MPKKQQLSFLMSKLIFPVSLVIGAVIIFGSWKYVVKIPSLATAFLTVISGTFVFAAGQIILKFFIEPIHKQKEVIGEIAEVLCYYRDLSVSLKKENEKVEISKKRKVVAEKLKKLRSQLSSRTLLVPYYDFFAFIRVVVKKQNIGKAKNKLTVLSVINSTNTEGLSSRTGIQAVEELSKLLDLGIY